MVTITATAGDDRKKPALLLNKLRKINDHLSERWQISAKSLEQRFKLRNHKDQQDERNDHGNCQYRRRIEECLLDLLLQRFGLFLVSGDFVQKRFQSARVFARFYKIHEKIIKIERMFAE